jgi:urease accessory protein
MRADARLEVARHGDLGSRVTRLRSDGPIVLRPRILGAGDPHDVWQTPGAAWVSRAAGAAGPLGGDDLQLGVDVGPGAALVLTDASASLALPGPYAGRSRSRITARVGSGGCLALLAQPVIAARGCDHLGVTTIELSAGARLLVREQLLLGRHGEDPGTIRQRLRVRLDGRPLYDQEVVLGRGAPGWRGAAVTGGRRAVGSVLIVDDRACPEPPDTDLPPDTSIMSVAPTALLVSSVARDGLALRQRLDAAVSLQAAGKPGARGGRRADLAR